MTEQVKEQAPATFDEKDYGNYTQEEFESMIDLMYDALGFKKVEESK